MRLLFALFGTACAFVAPGVARPSIERGLPTIEAASHIEAEVESSWSPLFAGLSVGYAAAAASAFRGKTTCRAEKAAVARPEWTGETSGRD
eukprot:g27596.t1